ncbi:unnamed protein product [Macrosiphum euphorbiae]|uniref:Uncharacterized protein n=1 Tax=Macrosiphum euphorbiae TaxID=13131 RepID=A0AAV0XAJ2_9HEMI|nr:unnamed protein product [Macrosiphum euphorbiae]
MPNIDVMTTEMEIQASYDDTAAVQTEFETLTGPYVERPVINAGQQDTVVITRKTVKPRSRSHWSSIKKNCRRVLCSVFNRLLVKC